MPGGTFTRNYPRGLQICQSSQGFDRASKRYAEARGQQRRIGGAVQWGAHQDVLGLPKLKCAEFELSLRLDDRKTVSDYGERREDIMAEPGHGKRRATALTPHDVGNAGTPPRIPPPSPRVQPFSKPMFSSTCRAIVTTMLLTEWTNAVPTKPLSGMKLYMPSPSSASSLSNGELRLYPKPNVLMVADNSLCMSR